MTIKTKSRINPDGTLDLHVPTGLPEAEVDVTVVVQPISGAREQPTAQDLGWPPGFFERTFGCVPDLMRAPQGDPDAREDVA